HRLACSTLFPYTTLFRSGAEAHIEIIKIVQLRALGDQVDGAAYGRHAGLNGARAFVHFSLFQIEDIVAAGQGAVAYTVHGDALRSEEHTSELQSRENLVC